jgi:negative regulator of flagellin synthesis FlgM
LIKREFIVKIENSSQPITGVSVSEGQKNAGKTASAGTSTSPQQNVHLTQPSSGSGSSSVVDIGRVQEIKQAISEGSFKVNPEAVADRLLETVRELLQHKTTGPV